MLCVVKMEAKMTEKEWRESLDTHSEEVYCEVGSRWMAQAKELLEDPEYSGGKPWTTRDLIELTKIIQLEYWETIKLWDPRAKKVLDN